MFGGADEYEFGKASLLEGGKEVIDSVVVSVDFSNKNDTGVMVVGRKRMNQSMEIINAFQGDEARELYERLITKKEEAKNE